MNKYGEILNELENFNVEIVNVVWKLPVYGSWESRRKYDLAIFQAGFSIIAPFQTQKAAKFIFFDHAFFMKF
jgi:hypothetical protein